MDIVDVCSTTNLDLTQRFYNIDNTYLKTNHKILLVNQTKNIENGLYTIDSRGKLISSDFLSYSGNTYRYKAYTKLGDNKHKQWHLKNSGGVFPKLSEPSSYISGKTYIIKNFFSYDINSTNPKLIFTDYDISRHINPNNYNLYSGFVFNSNILINDEKIIIKYHNNEYIINIDSDTNKFIYSGITSSNTVKNKYDDSVYTFVEVSSDFYNSSIIGDYVEFICTGNTNLSYKTYIKSKDNSTNLVSLKDPIPDYILINLSNNKYTITNLQWSVPGNTKDTLEKSYLSKYYTIDSSMNVLPNYYKYNPYFDYDGLSFIISGNTYNVNQFLTNNVYIKYKLYEHLNLINPIFDNTYTFLNSMNLLNFSTGFTILTPPIESSEYYNIYPKGTYLKIIPTIPSDTNYFKKNTFVNLNDTYKTLVIDVRDDYFIIETYKSNSGLTISSINTIYTLTGISELLYDVYKNEENEWYRYRDDDMKKNICISYSRIIEKDINITKYTTGLLTQDDKHKFVLEMYNPENLLNNGGHITYTYDPNLIYKPIELIEIGIDKHTKIPIPILNENLLITYDSLTGSTQINDNIFYFNLTSSSFFEYSIISDSITTLNINWGDGNIENITFNGSFANNHTYIINQNYTITFYGNLNHIKRISANGNISNGDFTKIRNLESLDLSNNVLIDLNIDGLIYIKNLVLHNNILVDSDKYFNIINSNTNIYGGLIDTAGGTNRYITSVSSISRDNLLLKTWRLYYNLPPNNNLPVVETLYPNIANNISDTQKTSAKLIGNITSNGGSDVNSLGFIYSLDSLMTSPITVISPISYPSPIPQNFIVTATPLLRLTTYYCQSFATNTNGTVYGNIVSFTTN